MLKLIRSAKHRTKLVLFISIVLSSVIEAVVEYVLTSQLVGWPTVVAGFGFLTLVWFLLSLIDDAPDTPSPSPSSDNTQQVASRSGSLATNELKVTPPPLVLLDDRYPPHRFCQRSPEQLVDSIRGKTDVAAARISKPNIGQLLRVSGKVRNVASKDTFTGLINVSIELEGTRVSIFAMFPDGPWTQWLEAADIGDPISVIGQISKVDTLLGGLVHLEACEVLTHQG